MTASHCLWLPDCLFFGQQLPNWSPFLVYCPHSSQRDPFKACHSSVQNLPGASYHTPNKIPSLYLAYISWPPLPARPRLLPLSSLLPLFQSRPPRSPCCSLNTPNLLPPQGLCTCCSLCLECSIPVCLHGLLPCFIQVYLKWQSESSGLL